MLRPGGLGPASPAPLGPACGWSLSRRGSLTGPHPAGSGSGPPPGRLTRPMPNTHTTTNTAHTTTIVGDEKPTGSRVPLAHYATSLEQRVLIGQRVDGIVRITDEPATGQGRSYLVESELESKAALTALISDYIAKSQKLDWPAMHGWF